MDSITNTLVVAGPSAALRSRASWRGTSGAAAMSAMATMPAAYACQASATANAAAIALAAANHGPNGCKPFTPWPEEPPT